MNLLQMLFGALSLLICLSAHGLDCDSSLSKLKPTEAIEFIKSRISATDYSCAIHATQLQAIQLSSVPGLEGFDSRFALRELAIDTSRNNSYPISTRLALLQAAAISSASKTNGNNKDEIEADVKMFWIAGKQFEEKNDFSDWLDTLALAIHFDQKLPDADRRILELNFTELIPYTLHGASVHSALVPVYKYIDQLATLAELTRGDKALNGFHSNLAFITYYRIRELSANSPNDSSEDIEKRCQQLLLLVNALGDDGPKCNHCGETWHWSPLFVVGFSYWRIGMDDEARKYINQAIQIIRSDQNIDQRIALYENFLYWIRGLNLDYDSDVIETIYADMTALANSRDTPAAQDVRKNFPKDLTGWGISNPKTYLDYLKN